MKRLFLVLALIAGTAGLIGAPASAQLGIYVRVGPPAPRYETRPPRPHRGWVWVTGHWAWQGRWVWVGGFWQAGRPGCFWIPGHWGNSYRGYYWINGHWRC
jgi:hypothetical protein